MDGYIRIYIKVIYIIDGGRYLDSNIYSKVISLFENYPEVLYGFSDVSYTDYKNKYKGVLVFAVPHSELLTLETYEEEKFETQICEARVKANTIQKRIECVLIKNNCVYEIPPASQTSEETLIAPLSFKYAAVNSHIGWIGKNGVLLTEKYGPRVRLSALLINFDFPVTSPIYDSKCPKECVDCINACPHKALKGQQWNINTKRSEIIDFQLCNQKRKPYIKSHNRKHSCGFCMVSCPYGL